MRRAGVRVRLHSVWNASCPGATGIKSMTSYSIHPVAALRRRQLLQGGAAFAVAGFMAPAAAAVGSLAAASDGLTTKLLPGPTQVRMIGDKASPCSSMPWGSCLARARMPGS